MNIPENNLVEFEYPTRSPFITVCQKIPNTKYFTFKAVKDGDLEETYATVVPNLGIAIRLAEYLHVCDARGDSLEEIGAAADGYVDWLIDDWRDLRCGLVGLLSFVLRRLRRLFGFGQSTVIEH